MKKTGNAWLNGLFLAATLAINTVGLLGLINGLSQKEISDKYITLITPSSSTFGIWSIIYTLLIISVIVMIIKKEDSYYKNAIAQISTLFRISCILNMAWIVAFSFVQLELSVLFILGFLIALSLICLKLLRIQVEKRFLLPLTFGLYTGWLFIATVVNIAAMLVKLKWNGFGIAADTWAIIILVVSVILTLGVLLKNKNAAFPIPIAWAYYGIYKFLKAPDGFKGQFGLLQIISLVGMAILIGMAAIYLYQNHFSLIQVAMNNKNPIKEMNVRK